MTFCIILYYVDIRVTLYIYIYLFNIFSDDECGMLGGRKIFDILKPITMVNIPMTNRVCCA